MCEIVCYKAIPMLKDVIKKYSHSEILSMARISMRNVKRVNGQPGSAYYHD